MLRTAQMKSNIDNLMPVSLKVSCPHLRRSFRSLASLMCLRRHMLPHGGPWQCPHLHPMEWWSATRDCCHILWVQSAPGHTQCWHEPSSAYRQLSDSASCCNLVTFASFAPLFSGLLHLLHYHFLVPCS